MTETISENLYTMMNEFEMDYVSENKIQESEIHESDEEYFNIFTMASDKVDNDRQVGPELKFSQN